MILIFNCALYAQSVQSGIVLEYNGTAQKKPLANVEIVVNNAASTVSDSKGNFTLQFRTLKPGDKITVRRIDKLGYEVFNNEAIGQWIITRNNEPLTVLMCTQAYIKKTRDKYTELASQKYAENLEKDRQALKVKLNGGSISKKQYDEEIERLKLMYEIQLENIDNYIERFTHIDLTELNEKQTEILNDINEGRFEDAMKIYDSENLLAKYTKESQSYHKLVEAETKISKASENKKRELDSLNSSLHNQISLLSMIGGKENFNKALNIMKEIANSDENDYFSLLEYADFAADIQETDEALTYYDKSIKAAGNKVQRSAYAQIHLGLLYYDLNNYNMALSKTVTGLHDLDSIKEVRNDDSYLDGRSYGQYIIGNTYAKLNNYDESLRFLSYARQGYKVLFDQDSATYKQYYAEILRDYAKACDNVNDSVGADKNFKYAIALYNDVYKNKPAQTSGSMATSYSWLGNFYREHNNLKLAEQNLLKADSLFKTACRFNPNAYYKACAENLNALGSLYLKENKLEEADEEYTKAYNMYSEMAAIHPDAYMPDLAMIEYSLGSLDWYKQDYDKAIAHDLKAAEILESLYKQYPTAYYKDLAKVYSYIGNFYYVKQDYKNAYNNYLKAATICPNNESYSKKLNSISEEIKSNQKH